MLQFMFTSAPQLPKNEGGGIGRVLSILAMPVFRPLEKRASLGHYNISPLQSAPYFGLSTLYTHLWLLLQDCKIDKLTFNKISVLSQHDQRWTLKISSIKKKSYSKSCPIKLLGSRGRETVGRVRKKHFQTLVCLTVVWVRSGPDTRLRQAANSESTPTTVSRDSRRGDWATNTHTRINEQTSNISKHPKWKTW